MGQLIAFIILLIFLYSPFIFTSPVSRIGSFFRFYCGYFMVTMPSYFLYKNYVAKEIETRGLESTWLVLAAVAWVIPLMMQTINRKGLPLIESTIGVVTFFMLYEMTNYFWLAFGLGAGAMAIVGISTLRKIPIS